MPGHNSDTMHRNDSEGSRRPGCGGGKLVIALIVAAASVVMYYSQSQVNPVTGEVQRVSLSPEQEVALGLQALPEMRAQFGGNDPDPRLQEVVDRVGNRIVRESDASGSPYVGNFEFHALADGETVNAFALPGGQIFITRALLARMSTEGQLAGVLGHEIGHVVLRHSAERIAKQQLTQGLTGAAVLATYDPNNPASRNSAAVAQMIGGLVNLKYGRDDELESDRYGVRFMAQAGYDPRSMIDVMKILAEAGGGRGGPEFFQTHPNPENRIGKIEEAIRLEFPNGVPSGLVK